MPVKQQEYTGRPKTAHVKPPATLAFLLSVCLLSAAVAFFMPDEGLTIARNIRLNFFTKNDLVPGGAIAYANIGQIIQKQNQLTDSMLMALAQEDNSVFTGKKADADSLRGSITRIEYPDKDSTLFYPLFSRLSNLNKSGQLIRIMHYGDSQIEDDRITSLIRNRLQNRFGGMGAGLVPAVQLYPYSFSMSQSNSGNWSRYIGFAKTDTSVIKHRRYGILGSFSSFTPNSNRHDTAEAWVEFSDSPYGYPNTRDFRQCRIFCGHNSSPFLVQTYADDKLSDAEIVPAAPHFHTIRFAVDEPVETFRLAFRANAPPEIYGIALDGANGVAVDNIPLRGSSGLFFTRLDEQLMADLFKELNVKLFILQFGGNFVPSGLNDFSGFESWFSSQILRLRKVCPDAAFLVVGVADMSVKEKNHYISNPNVEKVRDALRRAAFKSGAAFWDMYKAMGGRNSMPSWVFAEPPLASDDFVHFNPRGAKTIAQMLYNAFIYEYHRYENQSTGN